MKSIQNFVCAVGATVAWTTVAVWAATPMGTAFTYQGRLTDLGVPANGDYDFKFTLYDDLTGGLQAGSTESVDGVPVVDGLFTVELDFGTNFRGEARWLEIEVAPYMSGSYTLLSPRQELTPTPYALYATMADSVQDGISGSGTPDYVAKFTAARTIGDSTILDDGTNVGIGTASPGYKLDVGDIVESYNYVRIGAANYTGILFYDGEGTNSGQIRYNHTGDFMRFDTRKPGLSSAERMRITAEGDVGIGTTSPGERLSVNGIVESITGGFRFPDGTLQTTADTGGTCLWQQSASDIYYNSGDVGIGTSTPDTLLVVEKHNDSNIIPMATFRTTGTDSAGAIRFENANANEFNLGITRNDVLALGYNSNISLPSDLLRITSAGDVGIGTTAPASALDVVGTVTADAFVGDGSGLTGIPTSPWQTSGSGIYYTAGSVGIGTTSPSSRLHVEDDDPNDVTLMVHNLDNTGIERLRFGTSTAADAAITVWGSSHATMPGKWRFINNKTSGHFDWLTDGAARMTLTNSGDLGIGTDTPSEALEVVGNIQATGTLKSGSSIVIDGTPGSEQITSSADLELHVGWGRALRIENQSGSPNIIGGYSGNFVGANVHGATISGGGFATEENRITDSSGVIGGGRDNQAGDAAGTTGDAGYATVGGGLSNTAGDNHSTVGGGDSNTAEAGYATVGGGQHNTASGNSSFIGGGNNNDASDYYSFVGGGTSNTASGESSVVPGGLSNVAAGDRSFAAGTSAQANHNGAFVWGDSSFGVVASSAQDEFTARASGGVRFFTNSALTAGVEVAAGGGSWSSVSDRNVKANVESVDGREVLERVAAMPVSTWNYKAQDPAIRHMGPMAQDFHAAFGVGEKETMITTIDADGVALAAIQGLYEVVQEKDAKIAAQNEQIADLTARLERIEGMLAQPGHTPNGGSR